MDNYSGFMGVKKYVYANNSVLFNAIVLIRTWEWGSER